MHPALWAHVYAHGGTGARLYAKVGLFQRSRARRLHDPGLTETHTGRFIGGQDERNAASTNRHGLGVSDEFPNTCHHSVGPRGIHTKRYLLPAIQREFVWDTDQIRALFDSLLRGYPIGSFLFWDVQPVSAAAYTVYDFLTDYHERDNPYAPKAVVPLDKSITPILTASSG